jgi:hypothetical protein
MVKSDELYQPGSTSRTSIRAAKRALGISVHTGWGACVVVGGSPRDPEIVANEVIHILDNSERFCYHMAAEMPLAEADKWIASARRKATATAQRLLAPLIAQQVSVCAIVAKGGDAGPLDKVLASHPRIHTAEGFFYRDVWREACTVQTRIIPPAVLDVSKIGKLAAPPWGRDQKLAALAAWMALNEHTDVDR